MVQGAKIMDLIIDGVTERWLSKQEAEEIIANIIESIGMTKIGRFSWRDTDIGPSCWQMLMESHIAVDYMERTIWIHLSSCKPYVAWNAAQLLIISFEIHSLLEDVLLIHRGMINTDKIPEGQRVEKLKGFRLFKR